MSAIVTGHLGFIGKRLLEALNSEGYVTHGIDKEDGDPEKWTDILLNFISSIKPDVIFHVGACSDTLEKDVNDMMNLNYASTKILVDYCAKEKIPIIYSSSAANYGAHGEYPSNLYGWSKYAGEGYTISNGGIALRYFNVYGPGESKKGNMASVAYQMYIKSLNGDEVFLFPKNPRRDFVYIEDIVSANIHAYLNYESLKGKYYDVGAGTPESFESMLEFLGIEYKYASEDSIPKGYQFFTCSDRNKWLPGWQPVYNLEKGIIDYKKHLARDTNV
tara:strand:+ start:2323 stop:3147 length:825 start_codon:yes stop_codon:yes gene_type:complete